jgi:tRNA-specific 2-thiouridylase
MFTWLSKFFKKHHKGKVFVGVSGGVDSSVTAALLKDQGYDVVGVFIRTWQPDWITCTWRDERRDAMRVCAHLNIPFVELDLEQEYKQGVADYMITEYKKGRTPNPDVMCNREVKFGGFLEFARAHGAKVATGHYAQNITNQLHQGADPSKDQSYFLWTLTHEQLKHVLFPIGHLQKNQVRNLAEQYDLPTATKKDSQGICFIGEIDMKDFLRHYIDIQPGNVINEQGEIIGHHQGALFYTIGERHGFTITKKGTHDIPYYTIAKDVSNNTITVSQHPFAHESSKQVVIDQCVWRSEIISEKKYLAQIRYHGDYKNCTLEKKSADQYVIDFDEYDYSISPGQSIVVYDNQKCIGGGIVI